MKKLILFMAAGIFALGANAQKVADAQVPPIMKQSIEKLHPGVKVDKWEKEQNGYEAEFHEGGVEKSVVLGPNGQLMQTEEQLATTALPKAVSDYIAANMAGKKIKEASKITDSKNVVTYEAEVDGIDFIFDANGTMIRKEVKKADDKD